MRPTMVEFRWIKMFSFMMLLFHFTGPVTGTLCVFFRVGDNATLHCKDVKDNQDKCDKINWSSHHRTSNKTLVKDGKITEGKSNRLSVTEKCSLVIKKVTHDDAGRYICRQFDESGQQHSDTEVYLSVVDMTEDEKRDTVKFSCSVLNTGDGCKCKVLWFYRNTTIENNHSDFKISTSTSPPFSLFLTFKMHHFNYETRYKSFSCVVECDTNKYSFTLQPPSEEPGKDSTIVTTSMKTSVRAGETTTASTTSGASTSPKDWLWLYITVVVIVALSVLAVIIWKRFKGRKTQADDNVNAPEDGVSYATISFTKKTHSKASVRRKTDDDESVAVTYSTVRAFSVDHSNLYSNIS